jgi:hypothetical protein
MGSAPVFALGDITLSPVGENANHPGFSTSLSISLPSYVTELHFSYNTKIYLKAQTSWLPSEEELTVSQATCPLSILAVLVSF